MKQQLKILFPFYIDLRAISFARILIGIIVCIDIIQKIQGYDFYYSDSGIFSRENFLDNPSNQGYFSIFLSFDSNLLKYLIFSISILSAICLTIGYKTKISTILCWIILLSFHNRNIYLNQGGDDLLRMILFIGIFMPWDTYFSINSEIKEPSDEIIYAGFPAFLLIFQITIMYVMSGILKTGPEWSIQGNAIRHVFQLEQLARNMGKCALNYPDLLKIATYLVVYLEKFSFVIFLIPLRLKIFRNTGICLLILFHIGTALTMRIGIFPWVSIAMLIGLLVFRNENLMNLKLNPNWKTFAMLRSIFLCFVCALTLFFQLRFLGINTPNFPYINDVIYTLRLDHYWGMFAPDVYKNDGWFIMEANTQGGQQIDLITRKPLTRLKPDLFKFYRNDRYRKLLENIYTGNYVLRKNWIENLSNFYNSNHSDKIIHVKLIYMLDMKGIEDNSPHPIQTVNLYETDIN